MTYTARNLITDAYYKSGILSREFDTPSGGQVTSVGLNALNDVIGEKRVDIGMIPYETEHTFTGSIGQEDYLVPDLIRIDTLTFIKDSVRFPMRFRKRAQYFGESRVENIDSLPRVYYYEREYSGARVYVWYPPDEPYEFTLHGVFNLNTVSIDDDLETTLDLFYRSYLKTALAERLCTEFSYDIPINVARDLRKMEHFIRKKSRVLDLRMQKTSTLKKDSSGINWGYVNLGNGFLP